jgi:hypothetical protein
MEKWSFYLAESGNELSTGYTGYYRQALRVDRDWANRLGEDVECCSDVGDAFVVEPEKTE